MKRIVIKNCTEFEVEIRGTTAFSSKGEKNF